MMILMSGIWSAKHVSSNNDTLFLKINLKFNRNMQTWNLFFFRKNYSQLTQKASSFKAMKAIGMHIFQGFVKLDDFSLKWE